MIIILYTCLTSPYDIFGCAEKLLVGHENVEIEMYTVFYAYICWQSLIIITITITVYGSSSS